MSRAWMSPIGYLDDVPPDDAPPDPLASIRAAIRADLEAGPAAVDAAEPPRFIQYPHLPEAGANLCAPGETGKTALALNEKIRVACGMPVYPGAEVANQGPCVLITAEDGASRARYVLQRALADGVDNGQLTEAAAAHAKQAVRIIGWDSVRYGRIVKVDPQTGEMYRSPVYDALLELLAPVKPLYITLDPEARYACRCLATYRASVSFMRVCQPWPVERKNSTTRGSRRSVTDTLWVAAFGRPRGRHGFIEAISSSDSSCVSGSALMPALMRRSSAALGWISLTRFIGSYLTLVRFAQTDDAHGIAALDEDDDMESRANAAHSDHTPLAVAAAPIFPRNDSVPIEPAGISQRDPMLGAIARILGRIVLDSHGIYCTYGKCRSQSGWRRP